MPSRPDDLPVIPDDRGDDLQGLENAESADLVVFMAGNQFMVMPELMAAFRTRHSSIRSIFYETLPPKIELQQILAGGAWFRGRRITVPPDVYTSVSREPVNKLAAAGQVVPEDCRVYLRNRIALMVKKGNPRGIASVIDLGEGGITLSQPNPLYEDIAEHTQRMYQDAGGDALLKRIMLDKQASGETILTTVHHRETPRRLLEGIVDVGPVWATEIQHAIRQGLPLEGVAVGENLDQHRAVQYYACPIRTGRNPGHAAAFLDFLQSDTARRIYADFGFTPAAI
jgi:ABC-type molybdate transport system substrate-binding protein